MEFHAYTQPLVDAARSRGITCFPIPGFNAHYVGMELGDHLEVMRQSVNDRIGSISMRVLHNKASAMLLLQRRGFPVPASIYTDDADRIAAFIETWGRVVIKPADLGMGLGVSADITSVEQIAPAIASAMEHAPTKHGRVVVQRWLPGDDNRILVIDKRHVFGVKRVPAHVIGDGVRSVLKLVTAWNAALTESVRRIRLDDRANGFLKEQDLTPQSVPGNGDFIRLSDLSNAHQGAVVVDTTDTLCDSVRELAIGIARDFDCGVLGIDFLSEDISKTPGKIIELNPSPGLRMHLSPTLGTPRDVTGAILDMLFPETVTG